MRWRRWGGGEGGGGVVVRAVKGGGRPVGMVVMVVMTVMAMVVGTGGADLGARRHTREDSVVEDR